MERWSLWLWIQDCCGVVEGCGKMLVILQPIISSYYKLSLYVSRISWMYIVDAPHLYWILFVLKSAAEIGGVGSLT